MATPIEQQQRLREFGLSEYASRTYLALLKLGTTEARAVSRLAKVPIAKVYSTLDQLAEKGLCLIEPGPPKRFTPVPIEQYLDKLAAQYLGQAHAAEQQKAELSRLFPLAPGAHMDDRGTFQVLRGRRATVDKLRQLFEAQPQSILLHAADGFTQRAAATPIMQTARANGTRMRVLARIDPASIEALDRLAESAEVRAKPPGTANILVAVFDTKSALITHFIPDDSSSTRGQDVSLFTTEEAIVGVLSAFVESEWERAETFDEAKARLAAGDPAPVWRNVRAEDAAETYARLVESEASDVVGVSSLAPARFERLLKAPLDTLVAQGRRVRFVLDVSTPEDLEAAQRFAQRGFEVRHDPGGAMNGISAGVVGNWVMFSFRGEDRANPVSSMVTNEGRFRRAILQTIEARWAAATPLEERRRDLERGGCGSERARMRAAESAVDLLGGHACVLDARTGRFDASRGLADLFGLDGDAAPTPEALLARVHPDDRARAAPLFQETREHDATYRVLRPDGALRHVRHRTRALDVDGHRLLVGAILDRTDETRREQMLEAALARPSSGWWEYDPATRRATFSPEARDALGLPEVAPDPLPPDAPADARRLLEALVEAALRTGAGFCLPWRLERNGSSLSVRMSGEPVGGPASRDHVRIIGTLTWRP